MWRKLTIILGQKTSCSAKSTDFIPQRFTLQSNKPHQIALVDLNNEMWYLSSLSLLSLKAASEGFLRFHNIQSGTFGSTHNTANFGSSKASSVYGPIKQSDRRPQKYKCPLMKIWDISCRKTPKMILEGVSMKTNAMIEKAGSHPLVIVFLISVSICIYMCVSSLKKNPEHQFIQSLSFITTTLLISVIVAFSHGQQGRHFVICVVWCITISNSPLKWPVDVHHFSNFSMYQRIQVLHLPQGGAAVK